MLVHSRVCFLYGVPYSCSRSRPPRAGAGLQQPGGRVLDHPHERLEVRNDLEREHGPDSMPSMPAQHGLQDDQIQALQVDTMAITALGAPMPRSRGGALP